MNPLVVYTDAVGECLNTDILSETVLPSALEPYFEPDWSDTVTPTVSITQFVPYDLTVIETRSVPYAITVNQPDLTAVENLFCGVRVNASSAEVLLLEQSDTTKNGLYTWTINPSQPPIPDGKGAAYRLGTLSRNATQAEWYRVINGTGRMLYDPSYPLIQVGKGDADLDGWVTDNDAAFISRSIVFTPLTGLAAQLGNTTNNFDVDDNPIISALDASFVQQYLQIDPSTGLRLRSTLGTIQTNAKQLPLTNGKWNVSPFTGSATFYESVGTSGSDALIFMSIPDKLGTTPVNNLCITFGSQPGMLDTSIVLEFAGDPVSNQMQMRITLSNESLVTRSVSLTAGSRYQLIGPNPLVFVNPGQIIVVTLSRMGDYIFYERSQPIF
jgi:hypothetical protein